MFTFTPVCRMWVPEKKKLDKLGFRRYNYLCCIIAMSNPCLLADGREIDG